MKARMLTVRPRTPDPAVAAAPFQPAAVRLREAMRLLLTAERGRAVMMSEANQPTIRLGLALLPDETFVAIGKELLAAVTIHEADALLAGAANTRPEPTAAGTLALDGMRVRP